MINIMKTVSKSVLFEYRGFASGVYMEKKRLRTVSLDRLDNDTIEQMRIWRNQDFVRKQMHHKNIISPQEHRKWVDLIKNDDRRNVFVLYLDDEAIGVYQYRIIDDAGTIELGDYLISEDYQNKGYGFIISYAFWQIAYQVLHAKRGYYEVIESNTSMLKMAHRNKDDMIREYINEDGLKVFCYTFTYEAEKPQSRKYQLFHRLIIEEPWENRVVI